MAENKLNVGDIVEVVIWDVGEDKYLNGVVLIEGHWPVSAYTERGVYRTKCLQGNTSWIIINAKHLDEAPYLRLIGNINENKALGLLYGKSS